MNNYLWLYIALVILLAIVLLLLQRRYYLRKILITKLEQTRKVENEYSNIIHDELASDIYAAIVVLESKNKSTNTMQVLDILEKSYSKARNISHDLNKSSFRKESTDYSLKNVIRDFLEILNANNEMEIEYNLDDLELIKNIDINVENDIRRITTELITNAIKHSQAHYLSVQFLKSENNLVLLIEDDGVGFGKSDLKQSMGLGLRAIEERIDLLEGNMKIDSIKNQGTTVLIEIPLNHL